MRSSELLGAAVAGPDGRDLGPVRDIRVARRENAIVVVGLVIGGGRWAHPAHAWGYAEGRAQAPLVLRALTRGAARRARFVPAERVVEWSPVVRIDCPVDDLRPLHEAVSG